MFVHSVQYVRLFVRSFVHPSFLLSSSGSGKAASSLFYPKDKVSWAKKFVSLYKHLHSLLHTSLPHLLIRSIRSFACPFVYPSLHPSASCLFVRSSLVRSFVRSLVPSSVCSSKYLISVGPFTYPFTCSSVRPSIHSFVHLFVRSFIASSIRLFVGSFVHLFICVFIDSFKTKPFVHLIACPSARPFVRSLAHRQFRRFDRSSFRPSVIANILNLASSSFFSVVPNTQGNPRRHSHSILIKSHPYTGKRHSMTYD